MSQTTKQIVTEIWSIKGEKVFSEKDTLMFVNRRTGKIEEYQKVKTSKNEGFIIKNDGTSEMDTDEVYGCNGFKRARWVEAKITEQNNEEEN